RDFHVTGVQTCALPILIEPEQDGQLKGAPFRSLAMRWRACAGLYAAGRGLRIEPLHWTDHRGLLRGRPAITGAAQAMAHEFRRDRRQRLPAGRKRCKGAFTHSPWKRIAAAARHHGASLRSTQATPSELYLNYAAEVRLVEGC